MANTKSALKDARQSAVRAKRNRSLRSSVKTKVTKFRREVGENLENAAEFAKVAIAALDRAVSKGILHRNNAARRKSRLLSLLATANAAKPAAEIKKPAKPKAKRTTSKATKAASK